MRLIIPNTDQINLVLKRLESQTPISDEELNRTLDERPIFTGLDHWSLWTLVCLSRHLARQKWVGYIVESRLKGDLRRIGCAGAFGHPEEMPQLGDVPDEPEWKYYFHGCGCCLTNKLTGTSIDVDFTREGQSDKIDPFFYSNYLLSLSAPGFPEREIRREKPFEHMWQVELDGLNGASCIQREHGFRLTPDGLRVTEAIEPLSEKIAQSLDLGTSVAHRNVVYLALAVGDVVLANEFVSQANIDSNLRARILRETQNERQSRIQFLKTELQKKVSHGSNYLAAIGDLGMSLSEETVIEQLFRNPVDGTSNTALEILCAWNSSNAVEVLKKVLNRRYREATSLRSMLCRLVLGRSKQSNQQPRTYQITRATLALFQRVRSDSLDPNLKSQIRHLLENVGGAQDGHAALLMYVLDKRIGLHHLRKALSGLVPAAHKDAAAACVLIGSGESEAILQEALSNANLQVQHTAACALASFPSERARRSARDWFERNDGIKDPLGEEVTVLGSTRSVFTFDDISHVNMDEFFKWSLEELREDFRGIL